MHSVHNKCLSCGRRGVAAGENFCNNCYSPEKTSENLCLTCGKHFITLNKKQKWCTLSCLNKYKKEPKDKEIDINIRWDVLQRDLFTCRYCGRNTKDGIKLHVDHVIPKSKGGKYTMDNLLTACDECNLGKGSKTITYEAMAVLSSTSST